MICQADFGLPAVAGRALWNKACLPFHPSVLLYGRFLGIVSLAFSKFWYGARNPYEMLCYRQIFQKKIFGPQIWGNGPKMAQKQGFLNLLESFVIELY